MKETFFYIPFMAFIALFGAAVIEYGFGFAPCDLCIYQRIPWYLLLLLLPFVNIFVARSVANERASSGASSGTNSRKIVLRWLLVLILAIAVASLGLAAYHALLEWSLVSGAEQCGSSVPFFAIRDQITLPSFVSCTAAPFRVLGISPAGYNFILSFAVCWFALVAVVRGFKNSFNRR